MRSIDGLQPSEALDEILKYLLVKTEDERSRDPIKPLDAQSDDKVRSRVVGELRERFAYYLEKNHGYATDLFHSSDFRLSDSCLAKVHEILCRENLSRVPFDIRSAAIRAFLSPELRKGLGIFLTPDEIVAEMVQFFDFANGSVIADPACGSGTFLLEVMKKAVRDRRNVNLVGIDKSPRMMLLADLNMGSKPERPFVKRVADTLRQEHCSVFLADESVDFILTNPPFGVSIDSSNYNLSGYEVSKNEKGEVVRRQSSELLFLERCLSLLKPDGMLAIVMPRSAINTVSGARAREKLGRMGALIAIITLPPETFSTTGTMTNTVILFVRKFGEKLKSEDNVSPLVVRITNVGYDSTGRERQGNQLPGLGRSLKAACGGAASDARIESCSVQLARDTLPNLPEIVKGRQRSASKTLRPLGDFLEFAATGVTPPRKTYSDSGLFLIKVGNLTGSGLNWIPRDRNFIDPVMAGKRYAKDERILREGDIVLTSSAHSPKYIAKKIDVIGSIPEWVGGKASFVGEVMALRPIMDEIDPYQLLAYLRLPNVVEEIQRMIRGQTAHLHSVDIMSLRIDKEILFSSLVAGEISRAIREESELNMKLNESIRKQALLSNRLLEKGGGIQLAS